LIIGLIVKGLIALQIYGLILIFVKLRKQFRQILKAVEDPWCG